MTAMLRKVALLGIAVLICLAAGCVGGPLERTAAGVATYTVTLDPATHEAEARLQDAQFRAPGVDNPPPGLVVSGLVGLVVDSQTWPDPSPSHLDDAMTAKFHVENANAKLNGTSVRFVDVEWRSWIPSDDPGGDDPWVRTEPSDGWQPLTAEIAAVNGTSPQFQMGWERDPNSEDIFEPLTFNCQIRYTLVSP